MHLKTSITVVHALNCNWKGYNTWKVQKPPLGGVMAPFFSKRSCHPLSLLLWMLFNGISVTRHIVMSSPLAQWALSKTWSLPWFTIIISCTRSIGLVGSYVRTVTFLRLRDALSGHVFLTLCFHWLSINNALMYAWHVTTEITFSNQPCHAPSHC